jgi:hypothetical protein
MLDFRGICGIKSRWRVKYPLQRFIRRQLLHAQSPDSGDATAIAILANNNVVIVTQLIRAIRNILEIVKD